MDDVVLRRLEEIQQQVKQLVERVQPTLPLTLKPKEAAKLLSVSPSTIKGMIKRGEIIPTKVSGRQMVPSSEVVRIAGVRFVATGLPQTPQRKKVRVTGEGSKVRAQLAAERKARPSRKKR